MGYFNPITYFLKTLIRIFTRKFFWVILICICLFLGFIIFNNNGVFADSNYTFIYGNLDDVTYAQSVVGSSIWNNNNYDIFVFYDPEPGYGASVLFYDTSTLSDYTIYRVDTNQDVIHNGLNVLPFNFINILNNSSIGNNVSDYHIKTLYSNNRNEYYESFAPSSNPDWGTNFYGNKSNFEIYCHIVRSHFDFVDINGNTIVSATNPRIVKPYFVTLDNELQTFDFDYLQISGGTTPYYTEVGGIGENATLSLKYIYNGVTTNIDLTNYITVNSDNTWSVNIPYNALTNDVIVRNGKEFRYEFKYEPFYGSVVLLNKVLTYDLTTEQQQQINEDNDKQVQGEILQQQQETNKNISEMNNNITDSSVDDDITNGLFEFNTNLNAGDVIDAIDRFFNIIYNAFTQNVANDIVIPFPFTDKNIVIPVTYTETYVPLRVRVLISTCVWGVVGIYIYKRIMTIIDFVQSGEFDLVFKNGDVKKEEL